MQVNTLGRNGCDLWPVSDPVAFLAAHCGAAWQPAASLTGLFLLGLGGSLAHCGAMCGPIVAGQVADRLAAVPVSHLCEAHRIRAGLLLPYHAGRLLTYAALGAVSGSAGLAIVHRIAPVRGALLALAAVLLLASVANMLPRGGHNWAMAAVRRARRGGSFLFGMAIGLLPCGLLYAAVVGAGALASPWLGAAGMLAFGAGTVPVLAAVGIAGQFRPVRRALPYLLTANACLLLLAASVALRT